VILGLALLTIGVAVGTSSGSGDAQSDAATLKQRAAGRTLYMDHCAGCHGASGRGDGPAAASLRRTPTDLTGYAHANGGVFPTERLRTVIDGRGVGSHGSVDMPVWGSVFKSVAGSEAAARERIDAIVAYVRSLQERPGD
jgi:mono/diheme cytochrome c family protein